MHRHPVAVPGASSPLASVPLDHALIARLRASFDQLRPARDRLGELFYTKLFAAAPHVRPLFRSDQAQQAVKLIASLEAIVRNLSAPEENAAMLRAMGERHRGYGAKPEHYDLVVDLLIESMREVLGAAADSRVLEEWRTALRLVSRQMIAAAAGQSAAT